MKACQNKIVLTTRSEGARGNLTEINVLAPSFGPHILRNFFVACEEKIESDNAKRRGPRGSIPLKHKVGATKNNG